MMRCVAKLLLNMSRRRKSHTLSSTSPARRCLQPASRAELLLLLLLAHSLCRAVSGVSMGITYTHHCRHTYFCVSVRTAFNWFASVRRAGESRLSQCRMTAATGHWATGTGPRVTGNGHWSPPNKYLNLLPLVLLLLHALPFDNDFALHLI